MAKPRSPSALPTHLTPQQVKKLKHLQSLSYWWDNSIGIPGTKWRFGLESLVGFLPFGGDAAGILLSCYLVWQAMEFGLPKELLSQMVGNLLLDGLAGSVPMVGDFFDMSWKANARNINLLEHYLHTLAPHPTLEHARRHRPVSRWIVALVLGLLALTLLGLLALGVFVLHWLWQSMTAP
jgi:hypothetical protein